MKRMYLIPLVKDLKESQEEIFYFKTQTTGEIFEFDMEIVGQLVNFCLDPSALYSIDTYIFGPIYEGAIFTVTVMPDFYMDIPMQLNLELAVLDANGNVISNCNCVDANGQGYPNGEETCVITAPNSGTYEIQIFNLYIRQATPPPVGSGQYILNIHGEQPVEVPHTPSILYQHDCETQLGCYRPDAS